MLKKSAKIAMVGTLGLGITALGSVDTAFAEEKTYDSDAKIKFEQNTDATNPVDPENPDKEADPDDKDDKDNEDAKEGPLSLDYASSLDFGEQKISGNEETYEVKPVDITTAEGEDEERAPYLQVTDNRGSLDGWHVTVTQEDQLKTGDEDELEGAEITMNEGHVDAPKGQDTEGVKSNGDITLNPDGEGELVFDAKNGSGAGTFTNSFGEEGADMEDVATLSVPGGTEIEEDDYSAELTWTLTDAPEGD